MLTAALLCNSNHFLFYILIVFTALAVEMIVVVVGCTFLLGTGEIRTDVTVMFLSIRRCAHGGDVGK